MSDGRAPLVAVAEDDEDFRNLLSLWLAPHYAFRGFPDGESLLAELDSLEPDLAILDFSLPCASGAEIAGAIRERGRFRELPILFLTGVRPDIIGLPPGDRRTVFLTKPIECQQLLESVGWLLMPAQTSRARV